ncbi:MAG: hypothetical protein N2112_01085 [Gemmataceae bacterium]|nr:hypothetical protein [Gemmataceae bacterium]
MTTTQTLPPPSSSIGWIVSPLFDLLFLINLAWPLLLLPGLMRSDGHLQTEFWQIYFITTPHRWITLFLVASDSDRREGRGKLFIGIALISAAIVGGVWLTTQSLMCLLLIDYVWNAWHFASQHQGVLRMYTRKVGGGNVWLERHALRGFLVYVLLRTAGWLTGWMDAETSSTKEWLRSFDLAMLAIPLLILLVNLSQVTMFRLGKLAYLTSVLLLYSALLQSLSHDWRSGVIALTAAVSTFHAVEYLAVVSHYAMRRKTIGSDGLFRKVAGQWVIVLSVYLVVLGLVGVWADSGGGALMRTWLALNVWAAFLHYTYDGLIWKLRKPATARALGVTS